MINLPVKALKRPTYCVPKYKVVPIRIDKYTTLYFKLTSQVIELGFTHFPASSGNPKEKCIISNNTLQPTE